MNETSPDIILITEEEEGLRLDKILASRFREVKSRTYFEMLFEENRVLLNGTIVKKSVKPILGDEIQIDFILTKELGVAPEPIPLNILYEDSDILVVNKAPGMVVHPAVGNWSGTFVNALLYHCRNLPNIGETLRPGIVHRLDKGTSGLLIAAKSSIAHERLTKMFATRKIHKEYLAICVGSPGNVKICTQMGRHPIHRQMMTVLSEGGKEAITFCKTIACHENLSLVRVTLETGRTHQIRVHMKHCGSPVLGDPVYGSLQANKKYLADRQMLHAEFLRFSHPITGMLMELRADLPDDMKKIMSRFQTDSWNSDLFCG